jgi:hexosaminidase
LAAARDAAGKAAVRMTTELSGCDIYYTFDGTNPDQFAVKYAGQAVAIPGDASVVKAVAWRDGHASGRVLTLAVKDLK